jgi:RNA polymerase sigma factor (TIGR02999 family)
MSHLFRYTLSAAMVVTTRGLADTSHASEQGSGDAFAELLVVVYQDLKRIAHRQLARARPGDTLCTTVLVHELYLRLARRGRVRWNDRSHFFAVAAQAMRQIIIDYARRRCTVRRGGGKRLVSLDETEIAVGEEAAALLLLDDALRRLAAVDERLVRIVECRFFAGLSEEETANALGVSTRTVRRDWAMARSWLREQA